MNWFLYKRRWVWFYLIMIFIVTSISLTLKHLEYEFFYKEAYILFFLIVTILNFLPNLIYSLAGIPGLKPPPVDKLNNLKHINFLVIIPAYNEKEVILNSTTSLLKQKNGEFHTASVVVAFNGVDETGKIAENAGAKVVTSPKPKCGKSQAIKYTLSQIPFVKDRYVIIIDADNIVCDDFLKQVAIACQTSNQAYQCNHQPLLSNRNWISLGLLAAYAASSRLFNIGRSRLLNSALLCGTGMVIREDVFRFLWPKIKTQTEDIELNGLLSIYYNCGVSWILGATFYDEKPDRISIAIRQRVRWMVGHSRCFYHYAKPLFHDFFKNGEFRSLEIFFYYMTPFSLLIASVWLFFLIPVFVVGHVYHTGFYNFALAFTSLIVGYMVLLPALGCYLQQKDGKPVTRFFRSVLYSVYSLVYALLVWPIALFYAFMNIYRSDWLFHTPHKAKKVTYES